MTDDPNPSKDKSKRGAPRGNKNALKHGLQVYLLPETFIVRPFDNGCEILSFDQRLPCFEKLPGKFLEI